MRATDQHSTGGGQKVGDYLVGGIDRPLPLALLDMTSAHIRVHLLDDLVYLQTGAQISRSQYQ